MNDKILISKTFNNEALVYRFISDKDISKSNIQFMGKVIIDYQVSYWGYK